jgi:hypothetical protein
MRLDNEFVVPRPVDEAWAVLTDVERIAPCMPGAALTKVVDDAYHGTVRVKVGPVVAQYGGVARFTEMDAERHHAVLEAKGKERTGRGLASAVVTADLVAEGEGTRVTVGTELTISGPLAQFGRGAIAEVSARLLNQFVDRLKETVLDDQTPEPATATLTEERADPATAAMAEERTDPATAPVTEDRADPATVPATGERADPATPGPAAPQPQARVQAEPAAPADLLRVAALPVLKRLLPVLILIAVVIVVLVVWLS